MKYLIILFVLISSYSCNSSKKPTQEKDTIFIPGAPGGSLGNGQTLQKLINFTVTENSDGNHLIKWTIPATYIGQQFEIHLYRITGDGVTVKLPDPSELYSSAYLYKVRPDYTPITTAITSYTDITPLLSNSTYTYYGYVSSGDNWSPGVQVTLTTPNLSSSISIPNAANFWAGYTQYMGGKPLPSAPIFMNTFSSGNPTIGNPSGECAFAEDGGIMYCADTDNNRVMIWTSQSYLACKDYDKTSDDYAICKALFTGYPLSPLAVIGQKSFNTSYPCGHASNPLGSEECLTKPRGLIVANGRLIISDSGNDRIVVHPIMPLFGCYHYLNLMGEVTPEECMPYKVIGKQGLADMNSYTIAQGLSSLKNPTGLAYKDNDLYIADTGHDRILLVKNIFDDEVSSCESGTWQTSKCRFNAVLGQPDFTTQEKFSDFYTSSQITYDFITKRLSDDGYFLERHFANPTQVIPNGVGLIIVSNENFSDTNITPTLNMFARIGVYTQDPIGGNSPACNAGNFNGPACAATYIIGQTNPYNLVELDPLQVYSDIPYTIKDLSVALLGTNMLGVDKTTNNVLVWNDFTNATPGSGVPPTYRVLDPAGSYHTDTNRNLPDLVSLSSISIIESTGIAYLMDTGLGRIFEIPLKK